MGSTLRCFNHVCMRSLPAMYNAEIETPQLPVKWKGEDLKERKRKKKKLLRKHMLYLNLSQRLGAFVLIEHNGNVTSI